MYFTGRIRRSGLSGRSTGGGALRRCKAEAIAVRINYAHLPGTPWSVPRGIVDPDTPLSDLAMERVEIIHHDVRRPTHLAVSGVLGEKEGQPVTADLRENRKSRLEAVLPLHPEAQTVLVEGPRASPVR
jgi:hypothetical protein